MKVTGTQSLNDVNFAGMWCAGESPLADKTTVSTFLFYTEFGILLHKIILFSPGKIFGLCEFYINKIVITFVNKESTFCIYQLTASLRGIKVCIWIYNSIFLIKKKEKAKPSFCVNVVSLTQQSLVSHVCKYFHTNTHANIWMFDLSISFTFSLPWCQIVLCCFYT